MEAAALQEMRFNLSVFENTTHRARFRGSLVKFSNNPYATYGTPGIGISRFKYYIGSLEVLT